MDDLDASYDLWVWQMYESHLLDVTHRFADPVSKMTLIDWGGLPIPTVPTYLGKTEEGGKRWRRDENKGIDYATPCRDGLWVTQHAQHGTNAPAHCRLIRLRGTYAGVNSTPDSTLGRAGALQQASRQTPQ